MKYRDIDDIGKEPYRGSTSYNTIPWSDHSIFPKQHQKLDIWIQNILLCLGLVKEHINIKWRHQIYLPCMK
jgi:hypothetical protein